MKNLLIISSTPFSNLDLSEEIKSYIQDKKNINGEILNLETYDLPLFTPSLEIMIKEKGAYPEEIEVIKKHLISSDAIIWCGPEYNGGVSPIITNMIAWVSRTSENWKEGFDGKHTLICSSSGGNGKSFVKGFSIQLSYLGAQVMNESIIKTKKNGLNSEQFNQTLDKFCLSL